MGRALTRRAALALAGAVALAAWLAWGGARSPSFLRDEAPALWLRAEDAAVLVARRGADPFARYRVRFVAPGTGSPFALSLRAPGWTEVVLDHRLAAPVTRGDRRVWLAAAPGVHELTIIARGDFGPPVIWAAAPELGVYSGRSWEASSDDGKTWGPARDAARPLEAPDFAALPGASSGFWATLPWLIAWLALGAWMSRRGRQADRLVFAAAAAAWLVLAAAALAFLRPGLGYDAYWHADYAGRLARTWRLPAPGDAWQTFQAPLYYALCAPLWSWATALGREPTVFMRLPSLLSGFILGWACRRFVAAARPGRPDLAAAAGLLGWFLPANLYIAQTPSNEPLAAALAALFLAECARVRPGGLTTRRAAGLGAVFGAALLTKATAALALAPAAILLLPAAPKRGRARAAAALALAAFAAGGWFYARTWMLYGAPLVGGWNPARGIRWWQDPGYRSAGDFLRFGAALRRPFYAGLNGFWDALYSTLWNDGWQSGVPSLFWLAPRPLLWQAAGAWWGLVPSALIARGLWAGLRRRDAYSGAALLGLFAGLAAALRLFLTVAIYSTVKASYLLGLAPLAALALCDGLDSFSDAPRTGWWALLAAWAAVAFRGALAL